MKRIYGLVVLCALVSCAVMATAEEAKTDDSKAAENKPAARPARPPRPAEAEVTADTELDMAKVSYAIGMSIGGNLAQRGVENIDVDQLAAGLRAALGGVEPAMDDEELRQTLDLFQKVTAKREQRKREQMAAKNRKQQEEFFAENIKRKGVKQTESGLQYEVLESGAAGADSPIGTSIVVVNYRGMLPDGTEFDSSFQRGRPAEFPVTGVISGWTEALQMMKVGDKWKLYIPSNLAYGSRGAGRRIEPDQMLIFEVELLEVKERPERRVMPTTRPTTQPADGE